MLMRNRIYIYSNSSSDSDTDSESNYEHQHHSRGTYVQKGKGFDGGVFNSHHVGKFSPNYSGGSFHGFGYGSSTPRSYRYYSEIANAYHMKKSARAMRTVVQVPPAEPAYNYSDSYWNYPADCGVDYDYLSMGSAARMKNSEGFKVSPKKEAPPPPSPETAALDIFNPFVVFDNGYAGFDPISMYGYGSNYTSPDLSEVRAREGIPDLEEESENEVNKETLRRKRINAEAKNSSKENLLDFDMFL